jgi:hypothetical protein
MTHKREKNSGIMQSIFAKSTNAHLTAFFQNALCCPAGGCGFSDLSFPFLTM